jgi:hypothetical protein
LKCKSLHDTALAYKESNLLKKLSFVAGILAGMAAPGRIFYTPNYPEIAGNDLDRIRDDVFAIGGDFRQVINNRLEEEFR